MHATCSQVSNHRELAVHSSEVSSHACAASSSPREPLQSIHQSDVPLGRCAVRHPQPQRHARKQGQGNSVVPHVAGLCAEYVHHLLLQPCTTSALVRVLVLVRVITSHVHCEAASSKQHSSELQS